ncbi:hypothetical protein [uncultured Ornithinimicrobium sp.]|uniref:hypothetical protein n=1 Tax=uncultured Ornithinimicrobium sp. TaxID=259307 RepID=UPI00338DE69C
MSRASAAPVQATARKKRSDHHRWKMLGARAKVARRRKVGAGVSPREPISAGPCRAAATKATR